MAHPSRHLPDAPGRPDSWGAARRWLSAALLFALLATRFVVADDHTHLFDASSNESCAACLVGASAASGALDVAVLEAPRVVEFRSVAVVAPSSPVTRAWLLPFACGPPPAVSSPATDPRS